MNDDIPEGFILFPNQSPFMEQTGPYYLKGSGNDLVIGVRITFSHVNHGGVAHGGFLATLADAGMGYAFATLTDPLGGVITLNMTIDYSGFVKLGDWVHVEVDLYKTHGKTKFANAFIWCGDKRIARASGVFADSPGNRPPAS